MAISINGSRIEITTLDPPWRLLFNSTATLALYVIAHIRFSMLFLLQNIKSMLLDVDSLSISNIIFFHHLQNVCPHSNPTTPCRSHKSSPNTSGISNTSHRSAGEHDPTIMETADESRSRTRCIHLDSHPAHPASDFILVL